MRKTGSTYRSDELAAERERHTGRESPLGVILCAEHSVAVIGCPAGDGDHTGRAHALSATKRGTKMDRFDMLTAFAAVAEQGGFAAAARTIRSSPPAMTRAIARLEAHLGVRLFHWSTRFVRVTEEGHAFLDCARRVLSDLRDAELSVTGAGAVPHGTLVVTASELFGRIHIVPVVAALTQRHARLDVTLNLLDRPVQLAEEGIDVAVRIGDLADSALIGVRLGEVRRVLVGSTQYLHRIPPIATVGDLAKHDIVAFSGISPTNVWRFGEHERDIVTVRPRLATLPALERTDPGAVDSGLEPFARHYRRSPQDHRAQHAYLDLLVIRKVAYQSRPKRPDTHRQRIQPRSR